jgi:hypothetical protein
VEINLLKLNEKTYITKPVVSGMASFRLLYSTENGSQKCLEMSENIINIHNANIKRHKRIDIKECDV